METPHSPIAQESAVISLRLKLEQIDVIRTLLGAEANMELVGVTRILTNTFGPESVLNLLRHQTISLGRDDFYRKNTDCF